MPSKSSTARLSWTARSLSSLHASPSQLRRVLRVKRELAVVAPLAAVVVVVPVAVVPAVADVV